jgi:hypothetical protein
MMLARNRGGTTFPLFIQVRDDTGDPLPGLAHGDVTLEYLRSDAGAWTPITLSSGTLGAVGSAQWASAGGGVYQVGVPAAATSAGIMTLLRWSGTGIETDHAGILIDVIDRQSVDLGDVRAKLHTTQPDYAPTKVTDLDPLLSQIRRIPRADEELEPGDPVRRSIVGGQSIDETLAEPPP